MPYSPISLHFCFRSRAAYFQLSTYTVWTSIVHDSKALQANTSTFDDLRPNPPCLVQAFDSDIDCGSGLLGRRNHCVMYTNNYQSDAFK